MRAAVEDKGPGPKGPRGAPYEEQTGKLRDAAAVEQSGPTGARKVEVEDKRTATTRTARDTVTGVLTTELFTESVHYRDSKGAWAKVDSTLKASSGGPAKGWVNGANRFTAAFPSDLGAGAVTVADAGNAERSVALELLDDPSVAEGSRPGSAKGAGVVYDDAAGPGADIGYEVRGDAVKESITLQSAGALGEDGAVSFALRVGKGLRPVLDGDVVTVVDAKDQVAFTLPAPFMDDAAGAHSEDITVALTESGKGTWSLTVTPDAAWLGAAERDFPVVVDPTISYPSAILACSIRSTAATTTGCGGSDLPISSDTSGAQQRVLLRFDDLLGVIPAEALIEQAGIHLRVSADAGAVASPVDVREATAGWTSSATWNTRDGSTAWTTPGGDRAGSVSSRVTLIPDGSVQKLPVGELVQRWAEGASAHHGFILEKTTPVAGGQQVRVGGTSNAIGPSLSVDWQPRTGARKGNTGVVTQELTDRTTVEVNPATGNAVVTTSEYEIAGTGLDVSLAHTMNSLATAGFGVHGHGWSTSAGGAGGVRLHLLDAGVKYVDGTGAVHVFHRAVDGTYIHPMGVDADLAAGPNGTWTITDRASKVVQTFTPIGGNVAGLAEVKDRNGNTITFTYDPSATHPWLGTKILRSITDTRGRVLNINNPGYWNTAATDSANRSVFYDNSSEQLNAFTDTAGGQVRYTYDAAHRVTAITTPEGHRLLLSYDAQGRTTRLVRVTNPANDTGRTWEFTYARLDRAAGAPGTTTTIKDPNGNTTTYTSDGRGRVAKVVDARGKTRSATYSTNDDVATTTTPATGGGGGATSVNTFNTGTFTVASTRIPTGAGMQFTYGTGARLYDITSETDARGIATTYGYDAAGNTTSLTRGGTTTTSLYQGGTDPAYGGTVNCGPTAGTTVTATKAGVLCEERDALYTQGATAATTTGHRTAYRYDAAGQLTTMIPPGTAADGTSTTSRGVQTFTYDPLSRLITLTDGNGKTTAYDYDRLDRQVYVRHHDASVESTYVSGDGPLRSVTEYDSAGALTRATQYARDNQNQLQHIDAPEGFIDLSYDPAGRMVDYTDTGGTVKYRYNEADQLVAIAEPGGDCTGRTYDAPSDASAKCILFRVDDDGRRTGVKYPGGSTQTWALDDSGRTTRTVGTAAGDNKLDLAYAYTDPGAPATTSNPGKDTGLITAITDPVAGRKTSYSYDALDRLTVANATAIAGGWTVDYEAFCYDAAGNRTAYYTSPGATCSTAGPAIAATYDGANQMTAATGNGPTGALTGSTFSYDGNGNQTTAKSVPGRTITYNDRDQATSTTPTGAAAIPSTYAGAGNADRLTAGSSSFQSTPLAPAPGRSTNGGTTTWTVHDPDGQLIALRQGATANPTTATSYYPFTDQVDSVRTLVTATGTVAATYTYTAYGTLRASTGTLNQPYQYAGGYTDAATGLIKFGVRYYDPTHGRFTQPDPTGRETHDYLYARAEPISLVDPEGTFAYAVAAPFAIAAGPVGWVVLGGLVAANVGAGIYYASEHKKNARKSSEQKHQGANTRRQVDQGAEKKQTAGRYAPYNVNKRKR